MARIPMWSMMILPSQNRPFGRPKKVSPYGGLATAPGDRAYRIQLPLSVTESPKLKSLVKQQPPWLRSGTPPPRTAQAAVTRRHAARTRDAVVAPIISSRARTPRGWFPDRS
jgi:hypothetical protein